MIFMLTSLFFEAKPYIDMYRLKKIPAPGGIQIFEGDNRRLAVSGPGPVNAAAAAAYMLTRYAALRTDTFANIGAAGSAAFHAGDIVLCHKIVNTFTGKALYPEMLYKHPFHEGALGSVGQPASKSDYALADMEGAFAYEAAQTFLPSSQIQCIKVISDNLSPGSVTREGLEKLMYETAGAIGGWLESIAGADKPADIFSDGETRLMELISENLHMTFAMRQKFWQACGRAKIRDLNITEVLSGYSGNIAKDKKEGKAAFISLINIL